MFNPEMLIQLTGHNAPTGSIRHYTYNAVKAIDANGARKPELCRYRWSKWS